MVAAVESDLGFIEMVDCLDVVFVFCMCFIVQHEPFELFVFTPFNEFCKFAAHEVQLLARMGQLIKDQKTQVCKLSPVVSGHAADQGLLSVDDFVVGERKDEVLIEGIHH